MPKPESGRKARETAPAPQRAKAAEAQLASSASRRHLAPGAIVQRATAAPQALRLTELMALQRTIGNRAMGAVLDGAGVQPKLIVNAPGDRYEREADRVAEQVLRMPAASREQPETGEKLTTIASPIAQRSGDAAFEVDGEFARQLGASRGRGQALPPDLEAEFSRKFGVDFGGVTIHADAQADGLNRSIQARAFTRGQDIYLGAGQYHPYSMEGRRLLAHELTHVVQQNGARRHDASQNSFFPAIASVNVKDTIQRKLKTTANDLVDSMPEIKDAVDIYHRTKNQLKELQSLQIIELLIYEWKAQNPDIPINEWKTQNADMLEVRAEAERAITNLHLDVKGELEALAIVKDEYYRKRMEHTKHAAIGKFIGNLKGSKHQFQYLTDTGFEAMKFNSEKYLKAEENAKKFGITKEELFAIQIYTAGDYKYINSVLDNSNDRLAMNTKSLTEKTGGEGTWQFPLDKKGFTPPRERALKIEARQHADMAIRGLKKLPRAPTFTAYRGWKLTIAHIEDYYKSGKVILVDSFRSTSQNREMAEGYAKRDTAQELGLLSVLEILTVNEGRDVSSISLNPGEKETLILPGACFRVAKFVPQTGSGPKYYEVHLTEIPRTHATEMRSVSPQTAKPKSSKLPSPPSRHVADKPKISFFERAESEEEIPQSPRERVLERIPAVAKKKPMAQQVPPLPRAPSLKLPVVPQKFVPQISEERETPRSQIADGSNLSLSNKPKPRPDPAIAQRIRWEIAHRAEQSFGDELAPRRDVAMREKWTGPEISGLSQNELVRLDKLTFLIELNLVSPEEAERIWNELREQP